MDQKLAAPKPAGQHPAGNARRRPAGKGARDAFVLIAISLVAVALGLALHLQLAMSVSQALLVVATVYAALVSVHVVVRRNQAVADLEAEIETLQGKLAELSRSGAMPAPATGSTAEPRGLQPATSGSLPPVVPPPRSGEPPARQAARLHAAGRQVPSTAGGVPPPNPNTSVAVASAQVSPAQGSPAQGGPGMILDANARGAQMTPAARVAPPPLPDRVAAIAAATARLDVAPAQPSAALPAPTPPSSRYEAPAGLAPPPPPQAPVTAARPQAPQPAGDAPASRVETRPVEMRAAANPAPVAPSPTLEVALARPQRDVVEATGGDGGEATMAPYWALRPGAAVEPKLPMPAPRPDTAATPKLAPAPAPNVGSDAPPDIETMQSLIEQLAEKLGAPAARYEARAQAPAPAAPAQTAPAQTTASPSVADSVQIIGDQVAALRRTADTMRQSPGAPDTGPSQSPASAREAASPYARLAIVAEAVAADRIDIFLDPILALEGRKTRHFEVSVRLRSDDGLDYATEDLAEVIAGTGLLARIDAAKLTRTAEVADRLTKRGTGASLFANLSSESLSDNTFLDVFADTFVEQGPLCARLVLSFAQRDVRNFTDGHREAVATMAELGFRFALDHVTDLDLDFEELRASGFEFVKLDAGVFLDGMQAGAETIPPADICRHMSDIGLGLIVGGIADERDLAKIMGFGVIFGQGALFGAPRAVSVERPARSAA